MRAISLNPLNRSKGICEMELIHTYRGYLYLVSYYKFKAKFESNPVT